MNTFGSKSWYTIAKIIRKPLIQCNRRYLELTGGKHKLSRKGTWTKEEDDTLREQVRQYGLKNWVLVSKDLQRTTMPTKTSFLQLLVVCYHQTVLKMQQLI